MQQIEITLYLNQLKTDADRLHRDVATFMTKLDESGVKPDMPLVKGLDAVLNQLVETKTALEYLWAEGR